MSTSRREFIGGILGTAATSLCAQNGATAHIDIILEEPVATIAPEIYGHFIEHLGGVIYDGVWVGENSKIANTGGVRQAVVDALKAIHAPVIRWPGGCFADSYDWRDGVGAERNPRTNFWGGTDPNSFGTQEFMRFCQLSEAKPYVAANLRSLPGKDFYEWVEYCNSPAASGTTGAKHRAARGHPEPFNVHYWGVGNESWGCGGNFTPEDYASEFRRFTAWIPRYGDQLALIASGPNDHEVDWTRRVMRSMAEKHEIGNVFGLSAHYYTWNVSAGRTKDWDKGKGDAVRFGPREWYELLSQGSFMEHIVRDHWAVMAESDPEHHVKLIVDEWGAWYAPGTEIGPKYMFSQMPTLRDALLSGLTLDIFHRHSDKVAMANAAQLVNCLHSLMLASEDRFVLTPTYDVFKMYMPHMGATALRTEFSAAPLSYDRNGTRATLWSLSGSASLSGKNLTLTAVNPHLDQALETEIVVRGGSISNASGSVLTHSDMHAHNDFQHPDALRPATVQVAVRSGRIVHVFPPKSVTALYLTLG
jgi:alpha-N-arabinofuranosidase